MKKLILISALTVALIATVFYTCKKANESPLGINQEQGTTINSMSQISDLSNEQEEKIMEDLRILELGLIDLSNNHDFMEIIKSSVLLEGTDESVKFSELSVKARKKGIDMIEAMLLYILN